MTQTEVVIPEQIMTKTADSRGRVTLGSDFAGKRVTLAITESFDRETPARLSPENHSISVGQRADFDVIIGHTSTGVGAVDLTIEFSNPSIAKVTNVQSHEMIPEDTQSIEYLDDRTELGYAAFDADIEDLQPTLISFELEGVTQGSTRLSLEIDDLVDAMAHEYVVVGTQGGILTVE